LLRDELAVADQLARQMVTSRRIAGNPRLIKRFLNTLSIRKKLATIYKIEVDDSILAKVLLFERCATRGAFEFLVELVNNAFDGKPVKMKALERVARAGAEVSYDGFDAWKADHTFVEEWLKLDPALGDIDLRGALHVGRESLPVVTDDERVSKPAAEIAKEMMALRVKGSDHLKDRYCKLIPDERKYVMDKLLDRAAVESHWGLPDILWGLSLAADADADAAKRLVDFLSRRQTPMLTPSIATPPDAKRCPRRSAKLLATLPASIHWRCLQARFAKCGCERSPITCSPTSYKTSAATCSTPRMVTTACLTTGASKFAASSGRAIESRSRSSRHGDEC
jgi:predicted KAP-like P-loop ATPase